MKLQIEKATIAAMLVCACLLAVCGQAVAALNATRLRCEYLTSPMGINETQPRLSWVLESDERGQKQTAYRVIVASTPDKLASNEGDLWDSGKVASDETAHVEYSGLPLGSRQRCFWKVRAWDREGRRGPWSAPTRWEMGLLNQQDWLGKWIGREEPHEYKPAPMFRREFEVGKKVVKARAYICGLGYFELHVNGVRIGDNVLDPAQTDYNKRVFYVTHDVTEQLRRGENAAGVILGDGFYNQNIVWVKGNRILNYGKPRLMCQIEVTYEDGSRDVISSDPEWKTAEGPILANNVYAGEVYDARREQPGWAEPGFDDSTWRAAVPVESPGGALVAQMLPPIKRLDTLRPIALTNPKPGVYVYDLGQNFAGWARIRVECARGTEIKLRFTEAIAPDGMVDPASTGVFATKVEQTDVYTCKGDGVEVWEPRFTYHGFRYVEMTGYDGQPTLDTLSGIEVRTAVDMTGEFKCSDPMLNRIYEAGRWSVRSNIHSIPEDCPARERCGWLGDAHICAEMMIYSFEMPTFWTKFIGDIDTTRDGGLPYDVAPGKRRVLRNKPDWSTAYILLPWYLHVYYGDTRILERHYDGMVMLIESFHDMAKDGILEEGRGDWCPPGLERTQGTPQPITSTAFYFFDAQIMKRTAELLGKQEDAQRFGEWAEEIRPAFIKAFYDTDKNSFGSQTADALALYLGLCPDGKERTVAQSIARDVMEVRNGHHATGVFGSRHLYWALTEHGLGNVAQTMLDQTTYPSFGYNFSLGATTMWECWGETELAEGRGPRSLNHPFQAGFVAWFHQGIGGINYDIENPGFKHIIFKPHLLGDLTYARARLDSIRGPISSEWRREGDTLFWRISVPVNSTATVYLPAVRGGKISESEQAIDKAQGVRILNRQDQHVLLELESGTYRFRSDIPPNETVVPKPNPAYDPNGLAKPARRTTIRRTTWRTTIRRTTIRDSHPFFGLPTGMARTLRPSITSSLLKKLSLPSGRPFRVLSFSISNASSLSQLVSFLFHSSAEIALRSKPGNICRLRTSVPVTVKSGGRIINTSKSGKGVVTFPTKEDQEYSIVPEGRRK